MRQLFLSFLLVGTLTAGAQSTTASQVARISTDDAVERPLFKTFPGEIPYRIPAIAVNRRGELIAVSDYRPCGGDIGFGKVDLRYRISDNNGATWSREYVLAEGDGVKGSKTCGYGDAAIAADRGSDEAVVVCVTGNTVYGSGSTTRKNPNRVAVLHSTDGGHHWGRPVDITDQIYALFDQSRLGPVDALFFGSGRICQSRLIRLGHYYRLYAALCARPGGNRVVYSDDLGRTWQALGDIHTSPAPNGDEPKVEELPNGDVLLSSRVSGGRLFNISTTSASATQPAPGNSNRCSRKKRMEASKRCKTAPTVKFSSWMPETMPHIAPCASHCKVFPSDPDVPMWASTTRRSPRTNVGRRNGSITRPRILQQGGAVR